MADTGVVVAGRAGAVVGVGVLGTRLFDVGAATDVICVGVGVGAVVLAGFRVGEAGPGSLVALEMPDVCAGVRVRSDESRGDDDDCTGGADVLAPSDGTRVMDAVRDDAGVAPLPHEADVMPTTISIATRATGLGCCRRR